MVLGQVTSKHAMNIKGHDIWTQDIPMFLIFAALGYAFLLARGFVWIFVLKKLQLSIAYPLLSLSLIPIMLLSYLLFDESINYLKMTGALFIIIGSFLISQDKTKT